jgi:hypothetical protein
MYQLDNRLSLVKQNIKNIINPNQLEPSPRQATVNVLPEPAVLRRTARMIIDFLFARYPRRKQRGRRSLSRFKLRIRLTPGGQEPLSVNTGPLLRSRMTAAG